MVFQTWAFAAMSPCAIALHQGRPNPKNILMFHLKRAKTPRPNNSPQGTNAAIYCTICEQYNFQMLKS